MMLIRVDMHPESLFNVIAPTDRVNIINPKYFKALKKKTTFQWPTVQ